MAKEKFYLEKTAEEFEQHESMKVKAQKKQVIQLDNCLELFTKSEQLGENDLWSVKRHRFIWYFSEYITVNVCFLGQRH